MKNKRSIMAFSAIQILFFHLWINMFQGNQVEIFFKQTAYVGVDIFFFLSAYSLAGRDIEDYLKFEGSRFKAVYLKYILFAIASLFYAKWQITRLLQVVFGVELFKKGGGSFLWFLPAIMIIYLLFPIFQRCDKKNRVLTLVVTLGLWIGIGLLVGKLTNYTAMYIFYNRIPVFLLGYYLACSKKFEEFLEKKIPKLLTGIGLTALGSVLIFYFGYRNKLMIPFADMFYIIAIPAVVGLVLLVSFIPEVKPIKWIGSSTLEMYALQMVFGYDFCNKMLKLTGSIGLANLFTFIFVIVTAVLLQMIYSKIQGLISDKLKNKKEEDK